VSCITQQDVEWAVVHAARDAGEDIARERGWVLDRQDVFMHWSGKVSITWQLPNGWFHREFLPLPSAYDLIDESRARRLVPLKQQLFALLRAYDLGGPMPWGST
jgi:hypothetical protein